MAKRVLALLTALMMVVLLLPSALADEDGSVYCISSASDFISLSKKCAIDSWSSEKNIILTKDIDFSATEFSPLPYFAGNFDGGGHTIKGIKLHKPLSDFGIIRYISSGGSVSNLNVEISITATGTKSGIGGIAGVNKGTVTGCTADVSIRGGRNIGGIVGINDSGGFINSCTSKGSVYGEHYVGGIAGKNIGSISLCNNEAKINTQVKEVKLDLSNLNFDKLISADNMKDVTDIGGITGYNYGVILKSENNENVGFNHVGYNVGGIAGRQCGYIEACTNNAYVRGRKDIGGIVGQVEPYTVVAYSKNSLSNTMDSLEKLQTLVDSAISNASVSKSSVYTQLNTLKNNVSSAGEAADRLLSYERDRANESINSANTLSANLSVLIKDCADCTTELSAQLKEIKRLIDNDKLTENGTTNGSVAAALDNLSDSLDDLRRATAVISEGLSSMADSVRKLTMFESAFKDLYKGINDFDAAAQNLYTAIDEILKNLPSGFDPVYLAKLSASLKSMHESLSIIRQALNDTLRYINRLDVGDLASAIRKIASGTGAIKDAVSDMQKASENMSAAWDLAQKIGDVLGESTNTFDKLSKALVTFSETPALSLPEFDNEYLNRRDVLSDSLKSITTSFGNLNDRVDGAAGTLISDMSAISSQMSDIIDMLTNDYDEMSSKEDNLIDDNMSLEDDSAQGDGKLYGCINNSYITGDLNVGGVAGSMAIEYDFDPEDDAAKDGKKSLNFVYKTKAVIRECKNYGDISARKDNVGGIVGNEALGNIRGCFSSGNAQSNSGDYVGGIAGLSESSIESSYSKCNVAGKSYVGGIAGSAHNVSGCRVISSVDGSDEFIGAIAGKCDGTATENYFTQGDTNGIDSVSYAKIAQPVSYEEMLAFENLPEEFSNMKVTFLKGKKEIKTYYVGFGESLADIPSVPKKNKYYGSWSVTDFSSIKNDIYAYAEYEKYIGAIEGKLLRKSGVPAIICEGSFAPDSTFEAVKPNGISAPKDKTKELLKLSFKGYTPKAITVHYLVPDGVNAGDAKIYVLKDGKWKKAKTQQEGNYLLFSASSENAVFACIQKSHAFLYTVIVLLIAAAFLLMYKFKIFGIVKSAFTKIKRKKSISDCRKA